MAGIDVITLTLAKKFATKVSAGYSSVEVDEPNSALIFTLNDGKKATLHIPKLNSIEDMYLQSSLLPSGEIEYHVMVELTDGTVKDVGKLPEQQIKISKKEGNALTEESDGYYVSKTGVELNPLEDNMLTDTDDGLYVPGLDTEDNIEKILNVIKDNIETEDLDFSSF